MSPSPLFVVIPGNTALKTLATQAGARLSGKKKVSGHEDFALSQYDLTKECKDLMRELLSTKVRLAALSFNYN